MATDIDRKKLWGRSGSRCAICNLELTQLDQVDSIIGDEAHIRSRKEKGPRHDSSFPLEKLDTYENLILLCKIHHKLVDDNADVFVTKLLEETKRGHERRVRKALEPGATKWVDDVVLVEIMNGTELMRIASMAFVYSFDHDHPESSAERETIGAFLQSVCDWGDIANDIGPRGQVDGADDLHRQLLELKALGFVIMGALSNYRLQPDLIVPAAVVRVTRLTDYK